MPATIAEKRRRFAEMHQAPGCFVMPNPYDIGSAKYLASLGFPALATSSAGMAFAMGLPDGGVTRRDTLAHIAALAAAVDVPLNADFEAGFARDAEGVHESVRLCVGAGVAGLSIEDYPQEGGALYGLGEALDRLRAARAAIDASGETVLLTARSEAIWRPGAGGLPEALRRLEAFAEAGADVLFAPGVKTAEEVAEVVRVAGKLPVNVVRGAPGLTLQQLTDLGIRRISTGGALARVAWGAFMRAAQDIAGHRRFDAFAGAPPASEIEAAFKAKA
jgi:2-methylisocitrate lyase-like PEP mutase family enzyme